jgi:hypothetical protein
LEILPGRAPVLDSLDEELADLVIEIGGAAFLLLG